MASASIPRVPRASEEELANALPIPEWTAYKDLPTFDIRNGDLSDAQTVFIKATISPAYHWVPIRDLPPEAGTKAVDGFIRSEMGHLAENAPPNLNEAQKRKLAICLGVGRAVTTGFYRIVEQDLIPGERVSPILKAVRDDDDNLRFVPLPGLSEETHAAVSANLDLSEQERNVIAALVKCSLGIVAMQGYSLVMTNHHYLSDVKSQSRKVYAVVERAYWRSTDIESWFSSDLELIQDAMWHKCCHPILMSIKTLVSMDERVAKMLVNSGAGACASRLPAMESELRAANSYVTLLQTVKPMFAAYGGDISWSPLDEAVRYAKVYPPGVSNPVKSPVVPDELAQIITNRDRAVSYLAEMCARNKDIVAFCYGFYCAMSDSEMAGAGGPTADTLKSSFALSKLPSVSFASYNAGRQTYGDYTAARSAQRSAGQYNPPSLVIE